MGESVLVFFFLRKEHNCCLPPVSMVDRIASMVFSTLLLNHFRGYLVQGLIALESGFYIFVLKQMGSFVCEYFFLFTSKVGVCK